MSTTRSKPAVSGESPAPVARVKPHPWRAFNPGWLRDRPRQVPHGEVKKP